MSQIVNELLNILNYTIDDNNDNTHIYDYIMMNCSKETIDKIIELKSDFIDKIITNGEVSSVMKLIKLYPDNIGNVIDHSYDFDILSTIIERYPQHLRHVIDRCCYSLDFDLSKTFDYIIISYRNNTQIVKYIKNKIYGVDDYVTEYYKNSPHKLLRFLKSHLNNQNDYLNDCNYDEMINYAKIIYRRIFMQRISMLNL